MTREGRIARNPHVTLSYVVVVAAFSYDHLVRFLAKYAPSQNLLYVHHTPDMSSSQAHRPTLFPAQCHDQGFLQLRHKPTHKSNTSKFATRSRHVFSVYYNEVDSSHAAAEKDKSS
jgi:hypothetical protein